MFSVKGKRILITGASSGIGRDIAIALNSMGANLIITGRNELRLEETKRFLNANAISIKCDLTNEVDLKDLVSKVDLLDGVVFNAGIVEYLPVKFINAEKIKHVFDINFNSQIVLTQLLLKSKKIADSASLVFISSIASKIGVAGTALYSSSKAALNAYVKVLANELSTKRIRANTICPGIIETPMMQQALDVNKEIAKDYPLGIGNTSYVVGPCVFLLSDASKWITGTDLILDGGLTII